MQDAKFSLEQAWSAQLMFFDGLMRFERRRVEGIGHFFALVNIDRECFEEWSSCYRKNSGLQSLEKEFLSPDQILSLMIDFIAFFQKKLGYEISALLDLVQELTSLPSKCEKNLALWNQSLRRAADGELRLRKNPAILLPFSGDFQVSQFQAIYASATFLECVAAEFFSISADAKERMQLFLSSFADPAVLNDWQSCYTETCGKSVYMQRTIASEEIFSTTIAITALNCYRFGYSAFEIIELLNLMRSKPFLYEAKWCLWRQTMQNFLE